MKKTNLLLALLCFVNFAFAQITSPPQKTAIIIQDNNGNGKADKGDKIRYKTVIVNSGAGAANGVSYTTTISALSTMVAGSFKSSPLAIDDGYAVTGNVGINVSAANGLLSNDFDDNPAGLTITAGTFPTSNGSITIATDGSFTYNSNAGYVGSDSYTYTLNDGNAVVGVASTTTGLITFTVSNMIWFVDNAVVGPGTGKLNDPFKATTSVNAASSAGNTIFVKNTGFNYSGGIVLKNNQILLGSGHSGGSNLADILPFSLASHSNTLPSINGTKPVIINSSGDGIALASANVIRGLDIGNCSDFAIDANNLAVGALSINELIIANTTGGGFRADNGSGSMAVTIESLASSGGGNGINLINCAGSFTVNGGTITNPTGSAVLISGGSVVVNSSNTITDNSGFVVDIDNHDSGNITLSGNITSTATGLRVQNCGGGTITFSGSSKSLSTNTNTGVTLASNTGAVINFTGGGLVISTTSGVGFNATGGGTISVQGSANAITSTTGTALNITNTTISGSNVNFQSIAANGGSSTGIMLNTTGTIGGLIVTGNGSAASGGTIANKTGTDGNLSTGTGIYLNNTSNVSLSNMQLNDFQNFGIYGLLVNNFSLSNSNIQSLANSTSKNGTSDVENEGSINFGLINVTNGLTGTVTITNCIIEDGFEDNFNIFNLNGTLSQFTMIGTIIRDNSTVSPGNNGFQFHASGTASITGDITNCTFTNNRANGIQVITEGSASTNIEIGTAAANSGGTFTNNNIGVNIAHNSSGTLLFNVKNGNFTTNTGSSSSQININRAAETGTVARGLFMGNILNNTINMGNSLTGPGMRIITNGCGNLGGASNTLTIRVDGNNVSNVGNYGIHFLTRDGNGIINATVTNNISSTTNPAGLQAIRMDAGATSTNVCNSSDNGAINAHIFGNTASSAAPSVVGIRVRQRFNTSYRLQGYNDTPTNMTAVQSFLGNQNSGTITSDFINSGFQNIVTVPLPSN